MGDMLLALSELPPSKVQSKFELAYGPCGTAFYGF